MSDLLEAFKARGDRAGILLDFDGTLSEIVESPSEARPYPGVSETLAKLVKAFKRVAIVSGRSAHELTQWLGADLDVWGVHGAERSRAGDADVVLSPAVAHFEQSMTRVRDEAERAVHALDIPGALVEHKRVMVALHYRAAADEERAGALLEELARDLARRHGLWLAQGRMALELRPPIKLSKGDVIDALIGEAGLEAVLFAGDDLVDLPGFDSLDRLAERGGLAVRVAVTSSEAPAELLGRADLTVDGPRGMLQLLEQLL